MKGTIFKFFAVFCFVLAFASAGLADEHTLLKTLKLSIVEVKSNNQGIIGFRGHLDPSHVKNSLSGAESVTAIVTIEFIDENGVLLFDLSGETDELKEWENPVFYWVGTPKDKP